MPPRDFSPILNVAERNAETALLPRHQYHGGTGIMFQYYYRLHLSNFIALLNWSQYWHEDSNALFCAATVK